MSNFWGKRKARLAGAVSLICAGPLIWVLAAGFAFAGGAGSAFAQSELAPAGREVIETRLTQFATENGQRRARLRAIFQEAGCEGQSLADQPVHRSRVPNLVCTLPGTTGSVIVVGAHFDFVGAGKGVADNWSGAALLPTLFENLRGQTRRHTFVFVAFSDEEKGLKGSRSYVRRLTPEQKAGTRAMVNLDSLGLSRSKVWFSRADPKLADALYRVAGSMNVALETFNLDRLGSSDSEPFRKGKIPSITIHSLTKETRGILHSYRDDLQVIRLDDYYETYRLVPAYLALLDTALE